MITPEQPGWTEAPLSGVEYGTRIDYVYNDE